MHEENGVKKTRLVGGKQGEKKVMYECFDGALRNCVTSIDSKLSYFSQQCF